MKLLLKPVASLIANEPPTMQHGPLQHNKALFDALYEHARTIEPKVTRGAMFGSPAIFVGRKMAPCVFGNEVALKIPAEFKVLPRDERTVRTETAGIIVEVLVSEGSRVSKFPSFSSTAAERGPSSTTAFCRSAKGMP